MGEETDIDMGIVDDDRMDDVARPHVARGIESTPSSRRTPHTDTNMESCNFPYKDATPSTARKYFPSAYKAETTDVDMDPMFTDTTPPIDIMKLHVNNNTKMKTSGTFRNKGTKGKKKKKATSSVPDSAGVPNSSETTESPASVLLMSQLTPPLAVSSQNRTPPINNFSRNRQASQRTIPSISIDVNAVATTDPNNFTGTEPSPHTPLDSGIEWPPRPIHRSDSIDVKNMIPSSAPKVCPLTPKAIRNKCRRFVVGSETEQEHSELNTIGKTLVGMDSSQKNTISLANIDSSRFLLQEINAEIPERSSSPTRACRRTSSGGCENPRRRSLNDEDYVLSRKHSLHSSWPELSLRRSMDSTDSDEFCSYNNETLTRMRSLSENRVLMNVATALRRTESNLDHTLFDFLEQFEIIDIIGRSDTSEVYKVKSKKYGTFSAVKRSRSAVNSYCERSRQLNEINSVKSLPTHENVVQYYRCWQQEGYVYTEMDLCGRGSLRDALVRSYRGSYENDSDDNFDDEAINLDDEKELWRALMETASGLTHLHENDIIHLDIKPDNIMIDENKKYKIGDFGLAFNITDRMRDNPDDNSDGSPSDLPGVPKSLLTETKTTAIDTNDDWEEGDGRYCAPELLSTDTRTPTKAADVFSLGCTLFECILGVHFRKYSPRGTKRRDVRPFLVGKCSRLLAQVVSSMMDDDPSKRPTAKDVVDICRERWTQ